MAAVPNKEIVNGVQLIEFATLNADGSINQASWKSGQNFAPGSVVYTTNADTVSYIIPEDKFTSIFTISVPGDPDTFNFNCFELSVENYQRFFDVDYDILTNTITVNATRKRANLAIRLTTQPANGVKKIFTYPNTECVVGYAENFTKEALVQLAVSASINAFTSVNGKDAIYTVQTVNADGSVINATPATVSAGSNSNVTTNTVSIVGTATAASGKTITSTNWSQLSGPSAAVIAAPASLSTNANSLVNGVYVFQFSATDSAGIVTKATKQVTVAIP